MIISYQQLSSEHTHSRLHEQELVDVTGTVTVDCDTIEAQSGNVFLTLYGSENQPSAPVFVSTSSNPIIGAWVDGNINRDGTNTYKDSN